jgi:mRNA-degrading endonuclease toxin of MazEF toxin-antitoxin module
MGGIAGSIARRSLNHIRSIDRQRLVRRLGMASRETMRAVDEAILVSLGVDLTGLEAE